MPTGLGGQSIVGSDKRWCATNRSGTWTVTANALSTALSRWALSRLRYRTCRSQAAIVVGALRVARLQLGETVLTLGAGPVGLWALRRA